MTERVPRKPIIGKFRNSEDHKISLGQKDPDGGWVIRGWGQTRMLFVLCPPHSVRAV